MAKKITQVICPVCKRDLTEYCRMLGDTEHVKFFHGQQHFRYKFEVLKTEIRDYGDDKVKQALKSLLDEEEKLTKW